MLWGEILLASGLMLKFFLKRKEVATLSEPSVEQIRAARKHELRVKLDRLTAEMKNLTERAQQFHKEHLTLDSNWQIVFYSSDPFARSLLDSELFSIESRLYQLETARSAILSELAGLTVNAGESVHIGGKAVEHAI
jgi:hypothetical protein